MSYYTTTTSDAPTLAPATYTSLPPSTALDHETWHGSGFRPADVLEHWSFSFEKEMSACGACASHDVRCIFLHYFHHIVESNVKVELVCAACGKFTVHSYERL